MVSPSILTGALAANYHLVHKHLSPTEVGQLARDAKVKMVVLSHVVGVKDADLAEIRKWYRARWCSGKTCRRSSLRRSRRARPPRRPAASG